MRKILVFFSTFHQNGFLYNWYTHYVVADDLSTWIGVSFLASRGLHGGLLIPTGSADIASTVAICQPRPAHYRTWFANTVHRRKVLSGCYAYYEYLLCYSYNLCYIFDRDHATKHLFTVEFWRCSTSCLDCRNSLSVSRFGVTLRRFVDSAVWRRPVAAASHGDSISAMTIGCDAKPLKW